MQFNCPSQTLHVPLYVFANHYVSKASEGEHHFLVMSPSRMIHTSIRLATVPLHFVKLDKIIWLVLIYENRKLETRKGILKFIDRRQRDTISMKSQIRHELGIYTNPAATLVYLSSIETS